ncbi:PAS domain S-box protein [Sabulicella glaciei]|uniref:PAS domain S-box protein n=1 Tax=Sabulicella glaciei TaxID=2984948 RepID=A0ABT3P274_9PROT|nr:PAS domain S-box protein [Roseococcus sp. MDT2-1-1]MCW8087849.1 PAS domain S-box protein [Roseococcus sp. MDT2-1-1]
MSSSELDRVGRALLDTAADAIIVSDQRGTIRFWNPGAERIFGIPAAEALAQSLDIIIPEPQRLRHWTGFQQVMESGESRYGAGALLAVPALRGDGSRISVEFTIVPLHGPDGRMEGMAAILRDVTRRYEEVRALRRELATARGRQPEGSPPASTS